MRSPIQIIIYLGFFIISGCTSVTDPSATQGNANASLAALMEDYWQIIVTEDTLVAGVDHPYLVKATLPNVSPEHLAELYNQFSQLKESAQSLPDSELTPENATSKRVLIYELDNRLDLYTFGSHLLPLNAESGYWVAIGRLSDLLNLEVDANVDIYVSALKDSPRYLAQQRHWLEEGLKLGVTQPQEVLGFTRQSIQNLLSAELYLQPIDHLDKSDPRYIAASDTVEQSLLPALTDLYEFMDQEYIPQARTSAGLGALDNGKSWYLNRVEHFATLAITPEEVHQLGISEMARIQGEMKSIIEDLDFDGDFAEFLEFLRTDDQFYAATPEQLLKEASYYAKRADAMLPQLFGFLPRRPYAVEPVPDAIAPNYTTGRYYSPDDPKQAGEYWVNTYNLKKRPIYELPALTLHEGVPGHHLQISLSQEKENLPTFRREGYITAFGEGWGLYSEYLGEEVGFYRTPYERFGRLIYEAWRASRLVVDTGLHWYGWSRQQAMDYMADNTGLSLHNVQTEVDRYITWPGQAISYKLGELTIKRLRAKAESDLGESFDVREFHDVLLSEGSVPLTEMERLINNYIANK